MILYPAIDIMEGQAVRLVEGKFEDSTTYHDDPLEAARSWVDAGARFLHVVDLDGARSGEPKSLEHLRRIVQRDRHPGPVRRRPAHGRRRPRRAARRRRARRRRHRRVPRHRLPRRHRRPVRPADRRRRRRQGRHDRHRGLDADHDAAGRRRHPAPDSRGVRSFVYTDVSRDGKLTGPDLDGVSDVADAVRGRFIYSGGIGSLDDLRALAKLRQVNLAGVIAGQVAVREEVHGRRGPGRPRRVQLDRARRAQRLDDALQARHPLHGRGQRPRRQGHEVHRHPRRRRSGRARRALRRAGRRRAGVPRHHGDVRQARDRRRAGAPGRGRRVRAVHDRRRRARRCRTRTRCWTRARTRWRSTPRRSRGRS